MYVQVRAHRSCNLPSSVISRWKEQRWAPTVRHWWGIEAGTYIVPLSDGNRGGHRQCATERWEQRGAPALCHWEIGVEVGTDIVPLWNGNRGGHILCIVSLKDGNRDGHRIRWSLSSCQLETRTLDNIWHRQFRLLLNSKFAYNLRLLYDQTN